MTINKKEILSEKAIARIAKKNILEKNDKYMRILAKKKETEKLKKNELILPYGEGKQGEIQKLIWFNLDEEMIYDEEYGMEFPENYYERILEIRDVTRHYKEINVSNRNREVRYGNVLCTFDEYIQRQKNAKKAFILKSIPKIKAQHIKIKESIILELIIERELSIQEYIQKRFSNIWADMRTMLEDITQEEVIQAIDNVPLYSNCFEEALSVYNLKKILLQVRDNRNLIKGNITGLCLEYCLNVEDRMVKKYCIMKNYSAKMKCMGIEEDRLPQIYQYNKNIIEL